MSLSKQKERVKHYKSLGQLQLSHEIDKSNSRYYDTLQGNLSKLSKPKRQVESRLATEIHQRIITSKEQLTKYAKILKMTTKFKKHDSKNKVQTHNKAHHQATSTTKRHEKDRINSPAIQRFKFRKEMTQIGPLISQKDKEKKLLKKGKKPKSHVKRKIQHTESLAIFQKDHTSKNRQTLSRQKSRKILNKMYTEVSLETTPSSLMTDQVELLDLIGEGTFGKVFKGRLRRSRNIVAVKRVIQDSRYKNRELEIVKLLKNDFICEVLGTYMTSEGKNEYLNILMHFYDQNLYQRIKSYPVGKMPALEVKIIIYQLFKGLSYLHSLNVCHRDIKPQNLLLKGNKAVICDFGSAKALVHQQSNISYICARCYRAPELIFGSTRYTTQVDIWSAGCVILEILNGDPLFIGQTSISHLLQIIKKLGTPKPEQVLAMNSEYDIRSYRFPNLKKIQWIQIFPQASPPLLALLDKILVYSPSARATAIQALSMEYFDQLRDELTYGHISSMYHLSNFFNFSKDQLYGNEHLSGKLIPQWAREKYNY